MSMRVGGLATGMDIDQLVNQLMSAERLPLQKMEQDRTLLEWKRDGFREIYQKLYEFDDMMLDMKMSNTYQSKSVSSSNEAAVTATASSSTPNGAYSIEVKELARAAVNMSTVPITTNGEFNPSKPLSEQSHMLGDQDITGTFKFTTYNEDGSAQEHEFTVSATDSLNDVLKRITDADNNVRMFYDNQSNKVIMESTKTGDNNKNGAEINFNITDNSFFKNVLNLHVTKEQDGQDARFSYNGLEFTSKTNSYNLNGVKLNFNSVGSANLTVDNNVDASFESIMKFVDKYNEIVEMVTESQREEKYRDYKPLTQEQKDDMSEKEIELWEERAKSGILRGESTLSSGLFSMRQSWYSSVDTGGDIKSLTQIGIKTSSNYMDGGKLIVDEDELKTALREDPQGVQKLFSNNTENKNDPSRGLVNRVEDALEATMRQIEERAGKTTSTLDNYTLGKRMKDLNTRISAFETRLVQVESRYWNQFTAMEKAISRMNQQSAQLMSQFGGM